jgi:hypothetical protein
MKTTKTPAEILKEEFATRYNLPLDQIDVGITITGVSQELKNQILCDYYPGADYTKEIPFSAASCGVVFPELVDSLWVHSTKEDEEHNA